ncbi:MAG: penicillin acylase family protein, partial [Chloroflexota bacterium]|nr:penicillin acylase family protein [Chloroflexota bacterium]
MAEVNRTTTPSEAPSGRAYRHDGPYLASKVPPRDARLAAPVSDEVTIHWDRWGIAHIRATRPADLYFALGYATAQECLWRLDYCRRLARGELAARLGRGVLTSDIMMRRLGLGRHADTLAGSLPEAVAVALTALAGGINRWIEQAIAERRLPLEFDWLGYEPAPWTVGDSIALWKHRWWTLTGRLENIAVGEAGRRHLPPSLCSAFMAAELGEETIVPHPGQSQGAYPAGPLPGIPGGADSGEGSNNWAVSGTRTTTGFPVLCSDPHNPFGQPGQWFQAQLTLADASLDVAGAVLAGSPGVYFGRNRHLAWGFTNHVASARDLYVETVEPGRPDQYLEGGEWRPFEVERAVIAVADAPDTTHLSIEIRRTVRGPLVGDLLPALSPSESPISLRWTGLEVGSGLDALLGLNAAGNVGQALDALGGWVCPVANAVLADDQGRIAYHAIGRVPRRTEAVRAYRSAAEPGHAWQGYIAYEDLPQHADPPEGWVATANQPPWALDPPGLPYLGSAAWADGWRMRRIRQRLTAAPRLSPEAIADIQADVLGVRAAELAPVLVAALGTSAEPLAQRAVALLGGWDGSYDLSSPAP